MHLNKYLMYLLIQTIQKNQLNAYNVTNLLTFKIVQKAIIVFFLNFNTFSFYTLKRRRKKIFKKFRSNLIHFKFFSKKTSLRKLFYNTAYFSNLTISYFFNKLIFYFYTFNFTKQIFYRYSSVNLYDYNYLMQIYFFKIFNFFFNLNFINISSIMNKSCVLNIALILKKITPTRLKIYYFTEFSEILLSSFFTKNLYILYRWVKYTIENINLKHFFTLVGFIQKLFFIIFKLYKQLLFLKGFFIKFSGKFIKGSGRKRKTVIKLYRYSSSTKSLRLIYKIFYIRTISGIVGCTIKLSF